MLWQLHSTTHGLKVSLTARLEMKVVKGMRNGENTQLTLHVSIKAERMQFLTNSTNDPDEVSWAKVELIKYKWQKQVLLDGSTKRCFFILFWCHEIKATVDCSMMKRKSEIRRKFMALLFLNNLCVSWKTYFFLGDEQTQHFLMVGFLCLALSKCWLRIFVNF